MAAPRVVERLCLTARREEDVWRGRVLVEDALRIASFPVTPDRRLLVIRRLDLGVVDLTRSSAALASVVEQALRLAAMTAVPVDRPEANRADAVCAADRVDAVAAFLAALSTAGRTPAEWFWPRLIPGLTLPATPAQALRAAVSALLREPGGTAQVAATVGLLRRRRALAGVLSRLDPPDGPFLLSQCGPPGGGESDWSGPPVESDDGGPEITAEWLSLLTVCLARWGPADPRGRWVAAMAVLDANPRAAIHRAVPARAARLLARAAASIPRRSPPEAESRDVTPPDRASDAAGISTTPRPVGKSRTEQRRTRPAAEFDRMDGGTARRPRPRKARGPATAAVAKGAATSGDGAASCVPASISPAANRQGIEVESAGGEPREPAWVSGLAPTRAAGLLFAVPLLDRLGFGSALLARPELLECDAGAALLERLADRVGLPRDDPMRWALRSHEPRPDLAPGARAWVRRWGRVATRGCRRSAGLGIGRLIRRPGLLSATRTHIDVVFRLADADTRVRRAGLDLDPGWVPWLGRVVTFHYRPDP